MDLSSGFVRGKRHVDGSVLCSKIREEEQAKLSEQKNPNQQNPLRFSFKMQHLREVLPRFYE